MKRNLVVWAIGVNYRDGLVDFDYKSPFKK